MGGNDGSVRMVIDKAVADAFCSARQPLNGSVAVVMDRAQANDLATQVIAGLRGVYSPKKKKKKA